MSDPDEVPRTGVPTGLSRDMTVPEQADWLAAFLRRHPVSRRAALRGGGAALAALAVSANPWARGLSRAYAAGGVTVVGRRLSFGADAQRAVRLSGELTGAPPSGPIVADVGRSAAYGTSVPVEVRHLVSQVPSAGPVVTGAEQWFAHAAVDALEPGTRYHYRFRMPDGTVTPDAVFTTAPRRGSREPFTFTALGDHGTDVRDPRSGRDVRNSYAADDTRRSDRPASALVGRIVDQEPAFHLLAGDICYADAQGAGAPETYSTSLPQSNDYDPFAWSAYFAMVERSASTTPWMFTTGNHEMEALYGTPQNVPPRADLSNGYGGILQRLALPGNGPQGCPSVYTFQHGTVAVLSLDANDLSAEIAANSGYSGGAQVAWLEERLKAYRADPTVEFVVAFFHHCAFSTSKTHASDGGVRDALAPLFDRYSVDLAVQAHNHQYERTDPIRGGVPTRSAPDRSTVRPAEDGTTYVLVGSGGRPRYPFQPGSAERYRGDGISDTGAGSSEVRNSYVWRGPGVDTDPLRNPATQEPEAVTWSQVRYDDYAVLAVDVVPGPPGGRSTMTLRAITDTGREIDRLVLERAVPRVAQPSPPAGPTAQPTPARDVLPVTGGEVGTAAAVATALVAGAAALRLRGEA